MPSTRVPLVSAFNIVSTSTTPVRLQYAKIEVDSEEFKRIEVRIVWGDDEDPSLLAVGKLDDKPFAKGNVKEAFDVGQFYNDSRTCRY